MLSYTIYQSTTDPTLLDETELNTNIDNQAQSVQCSSSIQKQTTNATLHTAKYQKVQALQSK